MSLLFSLALAASCQNYSLKCECGLSVPFEGYQVVVVERCDNKEEWYPNYGGQQFDTLEECQASIPEDKACQRLGQ